MLKKSNRGFTILEVAVIIIIMGLIGVIAVPSVGLIRKQEVKKLAKEMCLDLTTQRIKAMSMGSDYFCLVELTDSAILGHNYDYKLSFKNETTGIIKELVKNKDNSKNIEITMKTFDEAGNVINPNISNIQFDNYGYMMEMDTTNDIYRLTAVIKYDTADAKIDFYGITGNYTIY